MSVATKSNNPNYRVDGLVYGRTGLGLFKEYVHVIMPRMLMLYAMMLNKMDFPLIIMLVHLRWLDKQPIMGTSLTFVSLNPPFFTSANVYLHF